MSKNKSKKTLGTSKLSQPKKATTPKTLKVVKKKSERKTFRFRGEDLDRLNNMIVAVRKENPLMSVDATKILKASLYLADKEKVSKIIEALEATKN